MNSGFTCGLHVFGKHRRRIGGTVYWFDMHLGWKLLALSRFGVETWFVFGVVLIFVCF